MGRPLRLPKLQRLPYSFFPQLCSWPLFATQPLSLGLSDSDHQMAWDGLYPPDNSDPGHCGEAA